MTTENGVQEAIRNLKDQVKTLFDHLHDIEIRGCPLREAQDDKIEKLEDEVSIMKEKMDELRMAFYKIMGAAVVLMWLGSFIASILAKRL